MLQISCLQETYNLSPICILEKLVQLLQLVVKNQVDSIFWLRVLITYGQHYITKRWLWLCRSPITFRQCPSSRSQRVLQILVPNWNCNNVTTFYTILSGGKVACHTQGYAYPPSIYGQNLASQWTTLGSDSHLQWTRYDWAPLQNSPHWRPILLHLFFSRVMFPLLSVFSQAGVSPVDRVSVLSHAVSQQHAWSWTWAAPMFVCKCMNEMAQLPCWQPRGQQVLHWKWIWVICCMQVTKLASKGFEILGRHYQKSRVLVALQRTYVLQKL